MTRTALTELKNITCCAVIFLLLGWGFGFVVMRQSSIVEKQTVEFERRLEVSKMYDVTMDQIKGE